jgi:hypothetical protein
MSLLRIGDLGDMREAAQVAEPENGLDPVGDATGDPPFQDETTGITPKVGLDECLGDACKRGALQGEHQGRCQLADKR